MYTSNKIETLIKKHLFNNEGCVKVVEYNDIYYICHSINNFYLRYFDPFDFPQLTVSKQIFSKLIKTGEYKLSRKLNDISFRIF